MEINQVTDIVIGSAIVVHKELGPGLLESIYEECIVWELTSRGLFVERQKQVPIIYKGNQLDCNYRLDLVVEKKVIVELKCADHLHPIFDAQMLTYLKLTGYTVGLILNFKVRWMKEGIRRIVHGYSGPSAAPLLSGE